MAVASGVVGHAQTSAIPIDFQIDAIEIPNDL